MSLLFATVLFREDTRVCPAPFTIYAGKEVSKATAAGGFEKSWDGDASPYLRRSVGLSNVKKFAVG